MAEITMVPIATNRRPARNTYRSFSKQNYEKKITKESQNQMSSINKDK